VTSPTTPDSDRSVGKSGRHRGRPAHRVPAGLVAGAVLVAGVLVAMTALLDRIDAGGSFSGPRARADSRPTSATPSTIDVTASQASLAPSQVTPQRPTRIVLASGETVAIRAVSTLPDGTLDAPEDIMIAGWWDGGAKLGEPYGAIVVAAHVDSTVQGLGPFSELLSASVDDHITVGSAALEQSFTVTSVALVPKDRPDEVAGVFSALGDNRLVLITCAGPYDPDNGGYQNIVEVTAVPAGPPAKRHPAG
jgi:hypothetical protein